MSFGLPGAACDGRRLGDNAICPRASRLIGHIIFSHMLFGVISETQVLVKISVGVGVL